MSNLKSVLYAEDDENDVFLMERAFSKLNISNPLRVVSDGKLAVAYLAGQPPYEGRELPALLMMDLSMPGKHGLEVLKWIKEEPSLASLPVIVFTSSNQESDIHRAYLLGANGFVIKPGDPAKLLAIVKTIQQYWLSDTRPDGNFIDFAEAADVPLAKPIPG